METIDELTEFLATATADGILGRLLYRGAAWSLMREEGVLPPNAPPLGATIETDLAEHGFALLRGAMALRAQAGASELTSKAFERAANAFEALVRNSDPEAPDRGFRRMIAAPMPSAWSAGQGGHHWSATSLPPSCLPVRSRTAVSHSPRSCVLLPCRRLSYHCMHRSPASSRPCDG
ncbi:hypothetical protein U8C32_04335 [Sinorhizobium medicae]|uniref:hypothetical protein n=1 Tax=Sinorhizobium medicae TaxID=110321 RepID=UPI00036A4185|nr:hypothetical protein [Sinorhizobium medicae]WQO46255.1 hypothetical protein U8C42_04400 [Sinorhizobium medicae]WQO66376.1 hypothetical protein U8C40_04135 [Sinorhizobium medicae]WQO73505.1 hypothetical protein U8C31_04115 [Sinorhizobium medicae]WQO92850.1 hypothetical protein U8C32_04335 [Sinorhizobium medicae]